MNVVRVRDILLMPSREPFIDEGNPRTTYIKLVEI